MAILTKEEKKAKMLEWATALESGKYEQKQGGWGSLEEGKLCCLNVALVHFTGKEAHLRSIAAEIFGESSLWCDQFMEMNDKKMMTFPQIAAEIKKKAVD